MKKVLKSTPLNQDQLMVPEPGSSFPLAEFWDYIYVLTKIGGTSKELEMTGWLSFEGQPWCLFGGICIFLGEGKLDYVFSFSLFLVFFLWGFG